MKLNIKTKFDPNALLVMIITIVIIACASTKNLLAETTTTKSTAQSFKANTTKPSETESPKQMAINFVQKIQQILTAEAKGDRKEAEKIKTSLSEKVADDSINVLASRFGHGTANLPKEKIAELQKVMITAWAAIINYYSDNIDYSQTATIQLPPSSEKNEMAHVVISTNGPAYPSLNDIVVVCIKEKGVWKVKLVDLRPNFNLKVKAASKPIE